MVIGRNEGVRLASSLESVEASGLQMVYSDSGSSDGSPDLARKHGVSVVELDPAKPFSAGRGRNEGLAEARRRWPEVDYAMFLDGDCILDSGFPPAAAKAFDQNPECAIVTGHLSERYPEASIYNRLCAIEWRSPSGPIENMNALGGIMAVRIAAFEQVGGFNVNAIAGEEPDLGVRLKLAGYSILKIDAPMATHDAQILRFGQWWLRAVRGGHALAHRFANHGRTTLRDGRREIMSDLFWGLGLPAVILVLAVAYAWTLAGRIAGIRSARMACIPALPERWPRQVGCVARRSIHRLQQIRPCVGHRPLLLESSARRLQDHRV